MKTLAGLSILVVSLCMLQGCETTHHYDPNAPVLPPTTAPTTGSADAALAAAKTY